MWRDDAGALGLAAAKAVVVVWSAEAVRSEWVPGSDLDSLCDDLRFEAMMAEAEARIAAIDPAAAAAE